MAPARERRVRSILKSRDRCYSAAKTNDRVCWGARGTGSEAGTAMTSSSQKTSLSSSFSVGATEPGLAAHTHGTQNGVWHPGCQTLTGRTRFHNSGQASSELISWSSPKGRETPSKSAPPSDPALGSLRVPSPLQRSGGMRAADFFPSCAASASQGVLGKR